MYSPLSNPVKFNEVIFLLISTSIIILPFKSYIFRIPLPIFVVPMSIKHLPSDGLGYMDRFESSDAKIPVVESVMVCQVVSE